MDGNCVLACDNADTSDCEAEDYTLHERPVLSSVYLYNQPHVLFALAPAISQSCATSVVQDSVAAASIVLFPTADYVSVQLVATHGAVLSVDNMVQAGPTEMTLFDLSSSIAGAALHTKSLISARTWSSRSCAFEDLEYARCLWGSEFHLCVPLFVPCDLSLLETTLQVANTDVFGINSQAEHIVTEYSRLASASSCFGTLTVGTRDEQLFNARQLSNLCLVALVSSLHLLLDTSDLLQDVVNSSAGKGKQPITADPEHDMELDEVVEAIDAGFGDDNLGDDVGTEDEDAEGSENSRNDVSCRAAVNVITKCDDDDFGSGSEGILANAPSSKGGVAAAVEGGPGKSLKSSTSLDVRQHPLTMCFLDNGLEQSYVHWFADNNLLSQRLSNVVTGFPWLLFSACKHPWRLIEFVPHVFYVMLVYLTIMSFLLWRRPSLYKRHNEIMNAIGFVMAAWFFPAAAGHVPIHTLSLPELNGMPWFPFMAGCLTNLIVPLFHKVRFVHYIPLQVVAVAVNGPHIVVLCDRCCGTNTERCFLAAGAWVVAISIITATCLLRFTEHLSRKSFLCSYTEQ